MSISQIHGKGAIKVVTKSDEVFILVPTRVNMSGHTITCSFNGQGEDERDEEMCDSIELSSDFGAENMKEAWMFAANNLEEMAKACRVQAKKAKA